MVKRTYLPDFIIEQFDLKACQELITKFLYIVEQFQLMLSDDEFRIKFDSHDELKVGGNKKPTNSKVESLLFTEYDNKFKKEELLLKYKVGFNSLTDGERKVFKGIFIDYLTMNQICQKYLLYSDKVNHIKKSAVVKFCLATGLDKYQEIFKTNI